MKMKDFYGLHFTMIRNTIYDLVLNLAKIKTHIDRSIVRKIRHGHISIYVMHPMSCQRRPGFSDLRKRQIDDNKKKLPWLDHPNTLH